ncbi:hypothetical protein Dxin01_03351 [Deinococcus xinjiangensis]|uniref:Uncharacterized protein n=1 Tax=Deinococcus xinjiangensis TaxID=457454 RepID=A0ABP9VED7_9DEIO
MPILIVLDNNKITTPLERIQAATRLQETFNLQEVEMEMASTLGIVMAELPNGLPEVLNALMAHPDVKTVEMAGEKSI